MEKRYMPHAKEILTHICNIPIERHATDDEDKKEHIDLWAVDGSRIAVRGREWGTLRYKQATVRNYRRKGKVAIGDTEYDVWLQDDGPEYFLYGYESPAKDGTLLYWVLIPLDKWREGVKAGILVPEETDFGRQENTKLFDIAQLMAEGCVINQARDPKLDALILRQLKSGTLSQMQAQTLRNLRKGPWWIPKIVWRAIVGRLYIVVLGGSIRPEGSLERKKIEGPKQMKLF